MSPARTTARRNLPLLLLQARGGLIARFKPLLRKHGLTEQQYRVLRALDVQGTLEPREICAICHLSSPSLAGVLARMEALDLVQRERLEGDQRRRHVSLTARSRRMFGAMRSDIESTYGQLEADLGADFVVRLYAMLDQMLDALGAPAADAPDTDTDTDTEADADTAANADPADR